MDAVRRPRALITTNAIEAMKKTTKAKAKTAVKVKDLKPKKDPKGGPSGSGTYGGSTMLNHNETLVHDGGR